MSTEKNSGRQYPLIAVAELTFADLPTGEAVPVFELPSGAVVTGGDIVVTQASDAGTSETIKIGDAADDDRYAAAVDGTAAARTALSLTGFKTSGKAIVNVVRTEGGTAATQGQYRIAVEYMIVGRTNENQG